jgi:hypothetical protein
VISTATLSTLGTESSYGHLENRGIGKSGSTLYIASKPATGYRIFSCPITGGSLTSIYSSSYTTFLCATGHYFNNGSVPHIVNPEATRDWLLPAGETIAYVIMCHSASYPYRIICGIKSGSYYYHRWYELASDDSISLLREEPLLGQIDAIWCAAFRVRDLGYKNGFGTLRPQLLSASITSPYRIYMQNGLWETT